MQPPEYGLSTVSYCAVSHWLWLGFWVMMNGMSLTVSRRCNGPLQTLVKSLHFAVGLSMLSYWVVSHWLRLDFQVITNCRLLLTTSHTCNVRLLPSPPTSHGHGSEVPRVISHHIHDTRYDWRVACPSKLYNECQLETTLWIIGMKFTGVNWESRAFK